jgi:hypothetical protein
MTIPKSVNVPGAGLHGPTERRDTRTTRAMHATAAAAHRSVEPTTRWLALGAVAGPVLFELAWIVLGVLQPATMTPYGVLGGLSGAISNPISGLGVGPNAGSSTWLSWSAG